MSRPKKSGPKVVPMNDSAAKTEEQPVEPPTVAPPVSAEPKPREKKTVSTFFDNIRSIPSVEWGKRAWIYVYCLEPVCNIKAFGENKYLVKSASPNVDEDGIMKDYGSGRYRLNLVYRKPGGNKGDEVDNVELEIYNPKYPPKIPRSVWQNDPRNERWAALLPKEEVPQPATPLGTMTEALSTLSAIRKDIREEMTPPAPPTAPTQNNGSDIDRFTSMVTAVKNILPQPAPPTENTMLNTIVTLLTSQIQSSEKKAEQLQAQLFQLMQKQNDAKQQPNGASQIKEIVAGLKDLAPSIKDLIPGGDFRPGKTTWLDIAREAAPSVVDAFTRIATAVAMRPAPGQPGAPVYPQANPVLPPPAGPPHAAQSSQLAGSAPPQPVAIEQKVWNFLQMQATPLMNYFRGFVSGDNTPDDFAEWVDDGYPPNAAGDSPLKDARTLGRDRIIALFKGSAAWPALATMEPKLVEFVDGVLAWQPEPDAADVLPSEEDEHIDMTAGGLV